MVGKYLIASYLYYECDYSMMEDTEFDLLCRDILADFDNLKANHLHGHLLDRDALAAGSGYHIGPGQWPTMVVHIALTVLELNRQGRDYLAELETYGGEPHS